MNRLISALSCGVLSLGLIACGGDDEGNNNTNNNTSNNNTANNNTANHNSNNNNTCDYDTDVKVFAFLEGKTLTMNGDDVPTHPNGFSRDVNFGAATQCVFETEIEVVNQNFQVTTKFAVLSNAPNEGDVGMCDVGTEAALAPFEPDSTGVLIENVSADCSCFDITVTYPGFTQEGRAQISADGTTVSMELYFQNQATGISCADGAVGADTVTLNGAAFAGDAVQVYQVQ